MPTAELLYQAQAWDCRVSACAVAQTSSTANKSPMRDIDRVRGFVCWPNAGVQRQKAEVEAGQGERSTPRCLRPPTIPRTWDHAYSHMA